jgi:hypothetical protein
MHLAVESAIVWVLLIATLLPLTLWVFARAKREDERIERERVERIERIERIINMGNEHERHRK